MSGSTTRLDPRAPFVIDTHDLGRRAGSMRVVQRDSPAPAGWQLELVEVPAGTPVVLDLRLESVTTGVLVSGTATVQLAAQCGRCLDPLDLTVDADVQDLFGYEPDPEDDEAPVLTGELLDIEPCIRDAVVLALPLNPLCADDCRGLCPDCGERLETLGEDHHHESLDTRWAALGNVDLATPPQQPSAPTSNDSEN